MNTELIASGAKMAIDSREVAANLYAPVTHLFWHKTSK